MGSMEAARYAGRNEAISMTILLASNHGKVFKSFMNAYLPDWEERENRLQSLAQRRGW